MAERLKRTKSLDRGREKTGAEQPQDFMDRSPAEILEDHPDSYVATAIRRGYQRNRRQAQRGKP